MSYHNRLETEKQELTLALDEANSLLDEEKNKTRRAHNTSTQIRHEMEKMIKEKDDEMDNVKKTQQRITESLQVRIE